jgi:hypothetical protein
MALMEDLAPDIVRHRLPIEGYYAIEVDEDRIRQHRLPPPVGCRGASPAIVGQRLT